MATCSHLGKWRATFKPRNAESSTENRVENFVTQVLPGVLSIVVLSSMSLLSKDLRFIRKTSKGFSLCRRPTLNKSL